MSLRLVHQWVWDCWFAQLGDQVHVFYLQAPRSLGDPDLRHRHARIGHAVSTDLHSWEVLPDPLAEATPGAFDDQATWTGSIARSPDGTWQMAYTGLQRSDHGPVQRVLWATSHDLITFVRSPGTVIEADPRWYERAGDPGSESETHWRDPWLFWDESTAAWQMLITARVKVGPPDGRGVIARASSEDLEHWTVHPPITGPGDFRQLEVPQLVETGGPPRILFSANASDESAARRARVGHVGGGSHLLVGASRLGPYAIDDEVFFAPTHVFHLYAGRLLHHRDRWWFIGWHTGGPDRTFDGILADPVPVQLDPDGTPRLAIDVNRSPPTGSGP